MPACNKIVVVLFAIRNGKDAAELFFLEQGRHPFLAARDAKFLSVLLGRPFPCHAELSPHLIEGDKMPVQLGISQRAITVENQGAIRRLHARPMLPRSP